MNQTAFNFNAPTPAPPSGGDRLGPPDPDCVDRSSVREVRDLLFDDPTYRSRIESCPCCRRSVQDYKIVLTAGLISALARVWAFTCRRESYEFTIKEIAHLLGRTPKEAQINYATFNRFVKMGGGIVFRPKDEKTGKPKQGLYGIHRGRAADFFAGRTSIPVQISRSVLDGSTTSRRDAFVGDFPHLADLLDEDGLFDPTVDLMEIDEKTPEKQTSAQSGAKPSKPPVEIVDLATLRPGTPSEEVER